MRKTLTKLIILIVAAPLLTSCATLWKNDTRRGVSSSLVDYLYPDGKVPPKHRQNTPHLQLPLTVGLAFVPSRHRDYGMLPESNKTQLLETVKQKFAGLNYVKEIVIVPETYMKSSSGFKGVGQIARLYNLDVVALVSYDQLSITSEKKSSLLYWTIAGAYLIKGNNNKATTFVDTAVFDVNSRKMLFRAPGVSEIQKSSTLVEVNNTGRKVSNRGFQLAIDDMSKNLTAELGRFKDKIKKDNSVRVSHRQGYSGGGGAMGWLELLVMFGLLVTTSRFKGSVTNRTKPAGSN